MDIEQGLRAELITIPGLENKVYPLTAPEGTSPPYLVYHLTNAERLKSLNGYGGAMSATYQFDIIHGSYSGLKSIMDNILAKIKNYTGNIGGSGPYIQNTDILTELETYEHESNLYHGIIECRFFYDE